MTNWNDILANNELKTHLKGLINRSRNPVDLRKQHTLVDGPSRTGKSSTLSFAIKAMFCSSADKAASEPCHVCKVCQTLDSERTVDRGLLAHPDVLDRRLLYVPFVGNNVTRDELHREILEAEQEGGYHHLFYIDEVQGLVRRGLDHDLLNPIDTIRNITWIVSTATTKGLDRMFRNRFHRVSTELPTVPALAVFLSKLCVRSDFNLKWDDDDTLFLLAKRSHQVVGVAIKCLLAARLHGMLTRRYVEGYHFEPPVEEE